MEVGHAPSAQLETLHANLGVETVVEGLDKVKNAGVFASLLELLWRDLA